MKDENPGQGTGARDEEVIGANDHLNSIASPDANGTHNGHTPTIQETIEAWERALRDPGSDWNTQQHGGPKAPRMPTADQAAEAWERVKQEVKAKGGAVLQEVYDFQGRFVIYPSEAAHVAHTLWVAHTFFMDQWDSTPRIAFLSPEPGSGKSRALEVTEPLVNRAIHAVNTTPAYLFRKVSDDEGLPVILYDEIDTVFGPKAKDNEDIRGMLNAGHRKGADAGRCTVKGGKVVTEQLPAYCAVALAGLNDLPDTLYSRSVIVRMRRRAPDEKAEPWRNRIHKPQGEQIRAKLQAWADTITDEIEWPEMPEGVEDRNADIWEALLVVANWAGGDWPERARVSAVSLVSDSSDAVPTMNIRLLMDLRDVFGSEDRMFSSDLLRALVKVEDAPWGDMNGLGRELTPRGWLSDSEHMGSNRNRSETVSSRRGATYEKTSRMPG